mmetsp:Transcript_7669/g.20905  ORF Transcript_7669/g.20905 Transcript_7669/m.20905 type:complete len:209 (+) Transcript_7669:323-949(+)
MLCFRPVDDSGGSTIVKPKRPVRSPPYLQYMLYLYTCISLYRKFSSPRQSYQIEGGPSRDRKKQRGSLEPVHTFRLPTRLHPLAQRLARLPTSLRFLCHSNSLLDIRRTFARRERHAGVQIQRIRHRIPRTPKHVPENRRIQRRVTARQILHIAPWNTKIQRINLVRRDRPARRLVDRCRPHGRQLIQPHRVHHQRLLNAHQRCRIRH